MNLWLENSIKRAFDFLGFQISRSWNTPVGDMKSFIQDVKKRGLTATNILDVGAYEGWFSEQISLVYPDSFFYLIEPLEEMQSHMVDFCKRHEQSKYFKHAVGSSNTVKTLRVADDLACSSLFEVQSRNEKGQEVSVITVDSLIKDNQIQIPEIVKIDVQGYELEVLKGAYELYGKTELFIIEVSLQKKEEHFPLIGDIIAFMSNQNYVVYDFAGFLRHPKDGSLFECDLCFVKRDSILRK